MAATRDAMPCEGIAADFWLKPKISAALARPFLGRDIAE